MSNKHACDVAGTHGILACVATCGCWHDSKVHNILYKEILEDKHYYWTVKHARQFFSVVMPFCLAPSAITLCLCPSALPSLAVYPLPLHFGLLLLLLTPRLRSPNSLFPLLVFIFASQSHSLDSLFPLLVFVFTSQSHASRCYCSSYFLPTFFYRPLP